MVNTGKWMLKKWGVYRPLERGRYIMHFLVLTSKKFDCNLVFCHNQKGKIVEPLGILMMKKT